MSWDPTQDAWLAGFIDGEGHFCIVKRAHRARGYMPQFSVTLRVDDLAVLERLAAAFGGRINTYHVIRDTRNDSPVARWHIADKRSLARLAAYLDRFPLRAKKAREYPLWRRAVAIYCERGGSDEVGELHALREGLMSSRPFGADDPDPVAPYEPQQRLEID